MKRKYDAPIAYIENFVANEYVAACWGVACSIDPANKYDKYNTGVDHRNDHCGTKTNQHIYTNSKGTPISMIEERTEGLGNLTCELYTDNQYWHKQNITKVKPGDYIYWTTKADDGRVWHHQGYVENTYPNRPNHS